MLNIFTHHDSERKTFSERRSVIKKWKHDYGMLQLAVFIFLALVITALIVANNF